MLCGISDQRTALAETAVTLLLQLSCCKFCSVSQRLKAYQESLSESSVAVQMQGGCVSAHAAAIDTVQVPAMCHRAIATVQALAMCHRAIATVQAPAMCHCQKLSRAGVHTSGVPQLHRCSLHRKK